MAVIKKRKADLDEVVLRFAGDSGDGMQLVGDRFTAVSAIFGNDISTFPNFPAEIRAPAGTVPGVSSFQVHISDFEITTPGDNPNVLVAMNPAALKANLSELKPGSTIIVNIDTFDERSLAKAGYQSNPLTDGSLSGYKVYEVPMTSLTVETAKATGAKPRDAERSKNFFALGLVSWMYSRSIETIIKWIEKRYEGRPEILNSNLAAFKAGYNFGETAELFETNYEVPPYAREPGTYTNITGNQALAYGLVFAAELAQKELILGSYPITPASDILHELAKLTGYNVKTLQAEDEIAGINVALGASYGGALGVTTTSGPGLDLKEETIGLAISLELPVLIVDVQRAGPSTGMPTKPEQSDLLAALFGRHGDAPVGVIAPKNPGDCFFAAVEAARAAIKYRTPIIILSDAFLANSSEPWKLPDLNSVAPIDSNYSSEPNTDRVFLPYERDEKTLARKLALPGTKGLEHRIGGLEKEGLTGNVSYDPQNHERMTYLRKQKVELIANDTELLEVDDPDGDAQVLVVGWGSSYGAILTAVSRLRSRSVKVAHAQLRWLNPLPRNLKAALERYSHILVPELNTGQLAFLLRSITQREISSFTKVQGTPLKALEVELAVLELLGKGDYYVHDGSS